MTARLLQNYLPRQIYVRRLLQVEVHRPGDLFFPDRPVRDRLSAHDAVGDNDSAVVCGANHRMPQGQILYLAVFISEVHQVTYPEGLEYSNEDPGGEV